MIPRSEVAELVKVFAYAAVGVLVMWLCASLIFIIGG